MRGDDPDTPEPPLSWQFDEEVSARGSGNGSSPPSSPLCPGSIKQGAVEKAEPVSLWSIWGLKALLSGPLWELNL